MIPSAPFLCFITDDAFPPVEMSKKALGGGAHMIQLRHKSASGEELYQWSVEIRELCRRHGAIFIVNDRVDIAIAAKADGVHLGQQDLPASAARNLLGPDKIIGISVCSAAEAVEAEKAGADYVGFGHIFPTASKEKNSPPKGPEAIAGIRKASSLPLVAIGGISRQNVQEVVHAGASGVAVIAAISRSPDPEEAVRNLLDALQTPL